MSLLLVNNHSLKVYRRVEVRLQKFLVSRLGKI